jgi:hypothetical protein
MHLVRCVAGAVIFPQRNQAGAHGNGRGFGVIDHRVWGKRREDRASGRLVCFRVSVRWLVVDGEEEAVFVEAYSPATLNTLLRVDPVEGRISKRVLTQES